MTQDVIDQDLKEHLTARGPSNDPDYLAWKEEQIKKALKFAEENPDKMIPQEEVWKKLGLAY